jgi:hypothetical protein
MNLLTLPIISLLPDHFPIRHSIFFVKKLMQCVLQIHSGICRCPRAREELPQGLQGAGTESHEPAQQWGWQKGKLSPFCHFTNSGTRSQKRTTFLAFSRYGHLLLVGFQCQKVVGCQPSSLTCVVCANWANSKMKPLLSRVWLAGVSSPFRLQGDDSYSNPLLTDCARRPSFHILYILIF